MTSENDLSGRRVLVIEDEYLLASETTRALLEAGAEVLEPCPTEEAALGELQAKCPDAAVLDIKLDKGVSFKLAKILQTQCVPFVFATGYDAEVIPSEFEHVARLEKPVAGEQVVAAVAKLIRTSMESSFS